MKRNNESVKAYQSQSSRNNRENNENNGEIIMAKIINEIMAIMA
jgi:hypothetical protein